MSIINCTIKETYYKLLYNIVGAGHDFVSDRYERIYGGINFIDKCKNCGKEITYYCSNTNPEILELKKCYGVKDEVK